MKREWKPGDVAMVECADLEHRVAVRHCDGSWMTSVGGWGEAVAFNPRPLVVIDSEDRDRARWLIRAYLRECGGGSIIPTRAEVDNMQAALRELANPTPPKPEEPTGLGAVVEASVQLEDGRGFGPCKWSSSEDGSWVCLTDGRVGDRMSWPFMVNVRVLSEGVEVAS